MPYGIAHTFDRNTGNQPTMPLAPGPDPVLFQGPVLFDYRHHRLFWLRIPPVDFQIIQNVVGTDQDCTT